MKKLFWLLSLLPFLTHLDAQETPTVSTLIGVASKFEAQYFGCRLEIIDSLRGDVLIRISPDGKAISFEADFPSANNNEHEVGRGGGWSNEKFSIMATRPLPHNDFSHLGGVMGDARAAQCPFFAGFSDLDMRELSKVVGNSNATNVVRKTGERMFCLDSSISGPEGGKYKILFEEFEPERFRITGWEITKAKGQEIVQRQAKFVVGKTNNERPSDYDSASAVKTVCSFTNFDSEHRPKEAKWNMFFIDDSEKERAYGLSWNQTIKNCDKTTMLRSDIVTFETISLPDRVKVDMFEAAQEVDKLLGLNYLLDSGKLVQIANARSIAEIESAQPFRKPPSNWSYYLGLGLPVLGVFLFLIWLKTRS